MDEKGLEIDGYTQSALTRMYIEAGMREFSWLWFRRFHLTGNMSFECYSAIIDAHGKHCHIVDADCPRVNWKWLEELYNEMIGLDVKPDVVVYGVLINAFADAESVEEALGYVDAMKRAGLPGNTVIYSSLIKLYTEVWCSKEAEETYKLLQLSESGPDAFSSNCKRLGRFEEAIQIAKQTRELGLLTDLLCYSNVLGLSALDGRWKEALGTFKEMVEASSQPDDYMFNSLGIALVKCGISKKAVDKLEATKKNDYQNGLQGINHNCPLDVDLEMLVIAKNTRLSLHKLECVVKSHSHKLMPINV
nr:pentatricopeptide repeat-containing protein At3g23020-like [Populus alba]